MKEYNQLLKKFDTELPHFSDGRIDYSDAKEAAVLNCFVKFAGKILLLKRSDKVHSYRGKWNSIGGFLDEPKPLEEKVLEELSEELNIQEKIIADVKYGQMMDFYDKEIDIRWYIFPVLVELKYKPEIVLDWEHTECVWIEPGRLADYDTVSNLEKVLSNFN